jgi:ABC-2 type transport system permease protein
MIRLWPVLRREYLERIRSKAFIIGTIVGPAFLAAITILPGLMMARGHGKPLRIAVMDASGELREAVGRALAKEGSEASRRFVVEDVSSSPGSGSRDTLIRRVLDGSLDGYLYLPPNAVESSVAEYHGKNVSNVVDIGVLDRVLEEAVVGRRLAGEGLPADRVAGLMKKLDLKTIRISTSGEREDRGASFLLSMVLLMALYGSTLMWGAALMNGVIEEKANRVVEIVVSSLPVTELFAGKLLGVGAVGLTQFSLWVAFVAGLGLLGDTGALGGTLPEIPPVLLILLVVYFLLGYFLYGALYVAVGAAVNSHQEAQSLAFPVMLPLVVGVTLFPMVLQSPDSALATTLSLIPCWTPLLMFLRASALMPPPWQIVLSIALTVATIVLLTWAAARIYRVGILMYGKRPTFPEILRWVGRP